MSESHGKQSNIIASHSTLITTLLQGHTRGVMKPRRMLAVSRTLFTMSGTSGQIRDAGRRATRENRPSLPELARAVWKTTHSTSLTKSQSMHPILARMNIALDMHHE